MTYNHMHAFIYQAAAGANTVYVKATVIAVTNQTIFYPHRTSSFKNTRHHYKT